MLKSFIKFISIPWVPSKNTQETSVYNQIVSTTERMIMDCRRNLELVITEDIDIASYSVSVEESDYETYQLGAKIELNPFGLYQSYLYIFQQGIRITLVEYTEIIIAHEIGHSVCPELKRFIKRKQDKNHECIEPMTLIKHEIYAWKHSINYISEQIPYSLIFQIACLSLQVYTKNLLGDEYVERVRELLKDTMEKNREGRS